jgi:hypothetical protein
MTQIVNLTVSAVDSAAEGEAAPAGASLLGKFGGLKSLIAKKPKEAAAA